MKALGPGARIADRYVLETVIARGGMGAVYRAIDERMGRAVAIKLLLAELAEDKTSIARFEREASASARLTHPAVVQVFDFGKQDGVSYIVMELVSGRTLASELDAKRRLDPDRACDIIEQALGGIGAANDAGIVHRDLKPGNIMLIPTGTGREVVKVLDFGIAQLKESAPYVRLTQTGAVLGTPTFMSPEQARGETCDGRTDVYAMGVVLWCCLTGQRPFHAPDVAATLGKVLAEMPPRADRINPSVPAAIAHATERAMEKRASARYATAAEFAQALMDARASAAIPATSAVSLPEAQRTSGAFATREMAVATTGFRDEQTRPSMPITSSSPPAMRTSMPTPVPTTQAAPGWQKWALLIVALALVLGVVLGGLIVFGVFELEQSRVESTDVAPVPAPAAPPSMPVAMPVLMPSAPVVSNGALSAAAPAVCTSAIHCCEIIRSTIDSTLPDCVAAVTDVGSDPAQCAALLSAYQQQFAEVQEPLPAGCTQ